ncbi:MAG: NAD-dependent epimerase/dehydratase family protein, partial [Bacteroidetes bacterium]|nr:NAD-dependent epimerase/dehydratase family protein [Bacteroidota bacterium]
MDKILIAGGSGFLGKNLSILLSEKGYEVRILTRGLGDGKTSFQWNSQEGILPIEALE